MLRRLPPGSAVHLTAAVLRCLLNVHHGTHNTEGIWFTLYQDTGTKLFTNHKELLKTLRASPGTATGDAIRAWFTFFAPTP